jgi:hypothetical protein
MEGLNGISMQGGKMPKKGVHEDYLRQQTRFNNIAKQLMFQQQ